eukprot:g1962.t1
MAAHSGKPGGGEALVAFFTKLPSLQVPEEELVIPSDLERYGLSEVVNRLLGRDQPIPFDFLVEGEFLRSSIGRYLEAHKLSSEKVLRLEFVLALREPEQSAVDEAPEWISSVAALEAFPSTWFAATLYDGTVRLYEGAQMKLTTRLSDHGLTGAAALPTSRGSHLVAACQDGTLKACGFQCGSGPSSGAVSSQAGAKKALQACAIHEDGTLLAAGGWSMEVCVWNVEPETFADETAGKRKAPHQAEAKFTLAGHSQVVTALSFGKKEQFPFSLLSGSWDCSIRVWDLVAGSGVCNWPVARAVTSFTLNPSMPQLATSHEDGHVSLWDIRAPAHSSIAGAMSLDASAGLNLMGAQVTHQRLAQQTYWKTGVAMPAPPGSDLRHKCPVTREHLSNELQALQRLLNDELRETGDRLREAFRTDLAPLSAMLQARD